jgi:hypothetical protein
VPITRTKESYTKLILRSLQCEAAKVLTRAVGPLMKTMMMMLT